MTINNLTPYEEPRIGVFVCDCGSNIAGHMDCTDVAEYAKTLPHVVYVKENLYTCSEAGIGEIKKAIKEQNLTRVVVASCSPRTHHPLFSSSCAEAGLNPYLFEMVNIRDQCSWVHMGKREEATQKAKELIAMGVAKSAGLEPQKEIESSLIRKILVIGGGIAGLSAAQALSDMNLDIILVEKTPSLGGLLRQVHHLDTGGSAEQTLSEIIDDIQSKSNITCYTSATVKETGGYIGNYDIKIETQDGLIEEHVGCIVVATGAVPLIPEGLYGYDGKNVISLMQLEQLLKKDELAAKRVVFIQCAGARTKEKEYCSRICCTIGVKNAMLIKEKFPLTDVRVLYRDMQMYGTHKEQMLWDARGQGIRFDVYGPDNPPQVENGKVTFFQAVTGKNVEVDADLVVLSTPLVPRSDSGSLANMLRVPTDQNGFFLEAHAKLRPLDFAADGIFVCGSGRYPATSTEARTQGIGVASRVAAILFKDKLVKSAIVAQIDPDSCVGCMACLSMCPYEAITYNGDKHICEINEILCKGCGNCAATCPSHSAQLRGFKPDQLMAQIGAA
ncbi:CoB--CoM heterodisulfide reductase iron-sulfur subunit A family protein [Desulfobacula phenolica]|uniref:Heterodisulfide reductase subunit A n=1 Tax=Desulfobacula phenolica TaxID=90732 RepID=A0A1H2DM90_9BACT|nr:CoB--CoM heterodisulfide reductase iron-sulfur subunit A family protein [Desulfobacula phenolica]SDT83949.1 heterodisulfide reductase subunit A [Desulfobacula phenolica]